MSSDQLQLLALEGCCIGDPVACCAYRLELNDLQEKFAVTANLKSGQGRNRQE